MLKNSIGQISIRSGVSNYVGKTIMTVVDAAIFFLVTKKLLINDYGVYSFLIAVLSFFAFFGSLGIPYTLLRFIPEYMSNGKKDTAASIIRLSLFAIIVFGLLLISISFFAAGRLSVIFNIESLKRLFPLLIVIGVTYIIIRAEEEILNSLFLQVFRNVFQVLASLLKLFLFIIVLQYGLGVSWLLMAIATVSILQALIYFVKINKCFPEIHSRTHVSKKELQRFSIFSAKEYSYVVTAFFWDMSLDIYIIAYLLGAASAGIFNFASSISFFLLHWSPGIVLQSVMSPLFVREYVKPDNFSSLKSLFKFYNKCKAFFAFPVVCGVWLLTDKIELILYHNKFAPAANTLKILVISVMLQAFTIPIRNIYNIFEKNEYSLYCNIVIFYRICASFVFIKYFGIIGAAYAYGTSMIFYFFMHLFFMRRIIKMQYPIRSFFNTLVNSSIMAFFIILLKPFMGDNGWWLLLVIVSALLVYLIASYINKPFKKEETNYIKESLGFVSI